ncbi:guanylate kinase [Patescibacteria group bacterium]|nr:guanylate kinase [Patescibacteria group bacterium]
MERGIFVIVVGPSGSGKNVLIQSMRESYPDIVFPTSCTTRMMRPGERDGKTYFFLSDEGFRKRIEAQEFLEWAPYGGYLYGTLKSEIIPFLQEGRMVLREVEIQGARRIKGLLPKDQLATVFIDAGPWDELERRIRARAPITDDELEKRRKRYADEEHFKAEADFVVENPRGSLEQAKIDMNAVIKNLRNRVGLA